MGENMAVTKDGVEVLTAYPREFRSLWARTDEVIATADSPDQGTSSLSGVPWPSTRRATPRAASLSAARSSKQQRYKRNGRVPH